MSTNQIVQLADSLVKGWETRIPAMNGEEWNQFRWWLNYLQGYAMFQPIFDIKNKKPDLCGLFLFSGAELVALTG